MKEFVLQRQLLTLSLYCIFTLGLSGQNMDLIDSILLTLPSENDSLNSVSYYPIIKEYEYVDFDLSRKYLDQSLAYAIKSKNKEVILDAKINLAKHFSAKSELSTSAEHYEEIISDLGDDHKSLKKANLLTNLAYVYCGQAYYDKGLDKFLEALKIVDENHRDDELRGILILCLGMIHGDLKNWELSGDYLSQSIEIFEEQDNEAQLAEAIMMRGVNHLETYKNEDARKDFRVAVNYYEKEGSKYDLIKAYSNLGAALQELDSIRTAEYYFKKGLEYADEGNLKHLKLVMLQRLGEVYLRTEEIQKAIGYWKASVPLAIEVGDIRAQAMNERFLAISLNRVGQYKAAYEHLESHKILQDSILSQDNVAQMNELDRKYQTERKEQDIKLLEEKNKRQSLEKKGLLGGILALLGLLGSLVYASRQRMIKNRIEKEKMDLALEFHTKELHSKKKELSAFALQLAQKNEVLESIKLNVDELKSDSNNHSPFQNIMNTISINQNDDNSWKEFRDRFQAVHINFESNIKSRYPKVTSNELRLMALLRMQLSSKEIANILNVSHDGVKKARYRLRKKLDMSTQESLEDLVLTV